MLYTTTRLQMKYKLAPEENLLFLNNFNQNLAIKGGCGKNKEIRGKKTKTVRKEKTKKRDAGH